MPKSFFLIFAIKRFCSLFSDLFIIKIKKKSNKFNTVGTPFSKKIRLKTVLNLKFPLIVTVFFKLNVKIKRKKVTNVQNMLIIF